jgi:hypothetical protein
VLRHVGVLVEVVVVVVVVFGGSVATAVVAHAVSMAAAHGASMLVVDTEVAPAAADGTAALAVVRHLRTVQNALDASLGELESAPSRLGTTSWVSILTWDVLTWATPVSWSSATSISLLKTSLSEAAPASAATRNVDSGGGFASVLEEWHQVSFSRHLGEGACLRRHSPHRSDSAVMT